MPDIEIDTSRLTAPSFTVPEAGTGPIDGSVTPPPTVTLPAPGTYHLMQSPAPASDVVFVVAEDGTLDFDAALDGIVEGRATHRLTLHGLPVHLDATALDHDLRLEIGGPALPADRPHDLALLPCQRYRLSGGNGNLAFALPVTGSIQLDPDAAGFASASGNALTVQGRTIRIDGTALSHDVEPTGLSGPSFLPRASVNELTLLPADGYGFQPGSGLVADLKFGVDRDGHVYVDFEFTGFASAVEDTLVLHGYPVLIDTTAADSDLVGLSNISASTPGPPPNRRGPREILYVLLPARGYLPQTVNGVLRTGFDFERDGTVTFPYSAAGRYGVASPTAPTPSEQGQEVTLNALVRPTDADAGPPRGTVTFSLQQGPPLGTAEVDDQGRASITTSDLPLGDSVIAIDYAGGDAFVPASTTVPHHVNPRQGKPVGDAPLAEVLDWALLPTLALMADPHAVDGHVKLAQSLLNAAGAATPALVVDGNFGVLTQDAVHTFRAGPILTPGDDIDTPVWFALAVAAPCPLLEPGPRIPPMTGPPVAVVQRLLNQQGAEPPLDDDGKYGPKTETAVRTFQMAHGLTVTGTVTPETWVALAGPPPTPTPSDPSGSRSMRLTFSYDSADWAQGGPVVRFVSREDLEMTAPLAADPDDSPHGRAGFWYELRDAAGRVLYRRARHRPIAVLREVTGPGDDGGLVALPVDAPRGTFELIAPLLPEGASVVLFSSPPDPDRLDEPASEIFSLPLDQPL
ncbi:peptidoglycan-binding protein [Streptomyces vietnamensis]|uniref:peptidoglycan-binding protein n=1 Tax=Streptomyces vietnamensis TaxID=362257 RepID=UPI00069788D9|nr:peptidoglycan-binding protein [Streptomyces vietnamensis]